MNWGTKIVLGMAAFMLFILGMVAYMFKVNDDTLVEEDYYEKGIAYNKEYEAKKNVLTDEATPNIEIHQGELLIKLKEEATYQLKLMRPSSARLDVKLEGKTNDAEYSIKINTARLEKGLWSLHLEWQSGNRNYLYTKDIML